MAKKQKQNDEVEDRDDDVEDDEPELTVVIDDKKSLEVAPTSERVGEEDDDEPLLQAKEKDEAKGKKKGKSKEEEDDEEEDDEEEDTRLGKSEDDEEEEDKKPKSRRQRRREAEAKLRNELRFYEIRNERLEKQIQELFARQDESDVAQIDNAIAARKGLIAKAEKVEKEATTAGKGDEAVEARKIRENAQKELDSLELRKESHEREKEEAKERPTPRPEVQRRASKWMKDNDWFDPKLGDLKSKLARQIDLSLGQDGLDPASDEYWKEFDKRLGEHGLGRKGKKAANTEDDDEDEDLDDDDEDEEERKPSKKKAKKKASKKSSKSDDEDEADDDGDTPSSGGPKFRAGSPARDLKPNEVYLSADRISAMKEAGVWDDPAARKRQLKKYQEWDKKNAHLYR